MQDFRNLRVWKDSHELTLQVYPVAEKLPVSEKYGLVSQIKRAVTSIAINLAEGCG